MSTTNLHQQEQTIVVERSTSVSPIQQRIFTPKYQPPQVEKRQEERVEEPMESLASSRLQQQKEPEDE